MVDVADPVAFGFVSNLARPTENVTGFSAAALELQAKSVQLLKELVPSATRVAFVQLRPGDIFTDDAGTWEVVGQPRSQRAGKSVVARVRRPGDPATLREQWWPAYERVTVKRAATT
jgi:ABC transporter substrate binding protein